MLRPLAHVLGLRACGDAAGGAACAFAGPAFIVGCGRSGTHLLANAVARHPRTVATIEHEPMFSLATRMALDASLQAELFGELTAAYDAELRRARGRLYVDKSHPNLWLAERLKAAIPTARFIGIERGPHATVASMLKHPGVLAWHARWNEFPIPNRFLGITPERAGDYARLPLAAKCALRWLAHHERMAELVNVLGADFLLISYEGFLTELPANLAALQQFLELDDVIPAPEVDSAPLERWRRELTEAQISEIDAIVLAKFVSREPPLPKRLKEAR